MILDETYTLNDGTTIPKLGLGTWFIDDDKAAQAVRDAVEIGYRLVDTAEAYGNERGVGEGIRTCGLKREELYVTTKLAAEAKTYDQAQAAIKQSAADLDIDYIDLMLIHAPEPWDDFRGANCDEGNLEAWRALEDARDVGIIRSIGISNFREHDIDNVMANCRVAPVCNQLLVHTGNTPSDLMAYSREQGMLVEAYSPIGHGVLLDQPVLTEMANRYGVSVSQLCVRYTLQLGCVSLPKTANPEHMKSNAQVDFEISDADMKVLIDLDERNYGEYAAFPVFSGK